MNELSLLSVLVMIAASVVVLAIFRRLNVPPLVGYVLVGAALGPGGLALVPDVAQVRLLAEFGVAFLLFTVGLKFSLPRLKSMGWEMVRFGGLQVAVSVVLVALVALAFGQELPLGILLGGALAMSSTAVVIRQLSDQREIGQPHGRIAVSVLIFQDLALVPFLALVPALAADGGPAQPLATIAAAVAVLGLMLAAGHWLLRPLMQEVARTRMAELFTLAVLLVPLGAAAATHAVGLSLALGAFLAGLMLAETEYRHQVEVDIRPFRDLLLGLFFITVGMNVDPAMILRWLPAVLILVTALVVGKAALVYWLLVWFGEDPRVAWRSGIALGQGGEFGIALLTLMTQRGLLSGEAAQPLLVAIAASMAVSPFLIRKSGGLAARLAGGPAPVTEPPADDSGLDQVAKREHVILCGYGRVGQNLARILEEEGFEWVAIDEDPGRVRIAREAGDAIIWGNADRPETLAAAGLDTASMVVTTLPNARETLRVLSAIRAAAPNVPVLVRARDDAQLELMQGGGATEVVPETLEASLMLASHALALLGVPLGRVVRKVQRVRDDRYSLLRTVFRRDAPSYMDPEHFDLAQLKPVTLTDDYAAVGHELGALGLEAEGVMVTAIRRDGIVGRQPLPETVLKTHDVLVLFGRSEDLERARNILLTGRH
ncbi:MAG: cation:proton antiporter [Gammaproteobacteria bacterium]